MCVVSILRNNHNNKIINYLGSLARQNYSNYQVVLVNEGSDQSVEKNIEELIFLEYPELKEKMTVIGNPQERSSFGSKHKAISEHCHEDEVVVDLDVEDELVGSQVLRLFNALYQQHPDTWLIYSNSLHVNDVDREVKKGFSSDLNPTSFITHQVQFETQKISHLRTFRRKLYGKVREEEFKDKDGSVHFRQVAVGDFLLYTALAELSGYNRIMFVDEPNIKHKPTDVSP